MLAPLIGLALLAVNHAQLVVRHDLSPWLGGGFGMFSAIDRRHVVATHLAGPQQGESIPLANRLEDEVERALALPTPARLSALATEISKGRAGCRAIRLEIWRTRIDRETWVPSGLLLATAHATCPAP